jgi:hypothetical protein
VRLETCLSTVRGGHDGAVTVALQSLDIGGAEPIATADRLEPAYRGLANAGVYVVESAEPSDDQIPQFKGELGDCSGQGPIG